MTLRKKTLSAFLIFGALSSAIALASEGTGTNGAEFERDGNNPWNLGSAPVEYCIEWTPSFGYNLKDLAQLVRESFDDWKAFFKKYGLDQRQFINLSDGSAKGLALDFIEVPKCDHPAKQIRILFGVVDPIVSAAIDPTDLPFGLALRHPQYDHETYRNGGTVWIRLRNFKPAALKHVLMHELGHVFGMRHNSVSVMMSGIAKQLISPFKFADSFGMIESPAWPYRFLPGNTIDYTYNGRFKSAAEVRSEPNLFLGPFRDVIAFDKNGSHSLSVSYDSGNLESRFNHRLTLVIRLAESGEVHKMSGTFTFRSNPARNGLESPHSGPELYTRSLCPGCNPNGLLMSLHLDLPALVLPAEGSFEFKGKIYPALIDQRNGPYLRIFNPEAGTWWGVDFYSGAAFLEHSP